MTQDGGLSLEVGMGCLRAQFLMVEGRKVTKLIMTFAGSYYWTQRERILYMENLNC